MNGSPGSPLSTVLPRRSAGRAAALACALALSACGPSEAERDAILQAARESAAAELEAALSQAIALADHIAGSADEILSPMPVMTPAEVEGLREFLNANHVARARELGVQVTDRAVRDSLVAAGRLVELADSTDYWIVRPRTSPAHVVPHVPALLELLGRRFQERLAAIGLPAYRIEVTSALRTSEGQDRLRDRNTNAAAGTSSHEFGTTVDLSYAAFAPPAHRPPEILAAVPPAFAPHAERIVDLALESVSARKSRELGAIFSQVLREAQEEGIALVIYESQQTVYHLTVARALADS
jgi:hypothetical protein